MELLVVRHAIAFERSPRRWPDDAERPLSPRGVARARKAALGLKRITAHPAQVFAGGVILGLNCQRERFDGRELCRAHD